MPIYEYICSACSHRTDILHGVHDPGPHFCPDCGTEGSMRKAIAAPAVHFKGTGWAKKERRAATPAKPSSADDGSDGSTKTSEPVKAAEPAATKTGGSAGDDD